MSNNKENVAVKAWQREKRKVSSIKQITRDPLRSLPLSQCNFLDQAYSEQSGPSGNKKEITDFLNEAFVDHVPVERKDTKKDAKTEKSSHIFQQKNNDYEPGIPGPSRSKWVVPDSNIQTPHYVVGNQELSKDFKESSNAEVVSQANIDQDAFMVSKQEIPRELQLKKLDMRFVTKFRGDHEHLSGEYYIGLSDLEADMQGSPLSASLSVDEMLNTPTVKAPIQGKSEQKKVKRSLKRLHTKDLQGQENSPVLKAIKRGPANLKKGSVFGEWWPPMYAEDYVTDNLEHLLTNEKRWRPSITIGRSQRHCLVNWIISVNGLNGNPAVVQVACWYLDLYLSKTTVPLPRLQLIAAACYWIAAKLIGAYVSSPRLAKYSASAFTAAQLAAAERQVLSGLNFPCRPVVPYDFIPHMCAWCVDMDGSYTSSAGFVALCVSLVHTPGYEYAPSLIAAACVRNVMRLVGRSGSLTKLETCPLYKTVVLEFPDFRSICMMVRDSVRTVTAKTFKYKAPFEKYSGPPYFAALKVTDAINSKKILKQDMRLKACTQK